MDSFTDGSCNLAMTSMFVPNPVMSLSVSPKDSSQSDKFGKAIGRFCKEDPTLRVHTDPISKEVILSGMGELHLEVALLYSYKTHTLFRSQNVMCVQMCIT